jgi:hypothetical protein
MGHDRGGDEKARGGGKKLEEKFPFDRTRCARKRRLQSDLVQAAHWIRDAGVHAGNSQAEQVLAQCDGLLDTARDAAKHNRFLAYQCLHAIERSLVELMSPVEVEAALVMYFAESESDKLSNWRRKAASAIGQKLLTKDDAGGAGASTPHHTAKEQPLDPKHDPRKVALQALMHNVHTAQQNSQHKLELVEGQIWILAVLLVVAATCFGAWAHWGGFEWVQSGKDSITFATLVGNGMLFGFLGGLLSIAFGRMKTDFTGSISELRASTAVTIARPFVGAAVAIPISLLLTSNLITWNDKSPALALVLCFLGGFSERWFIDQVQRISGKGEG